MLRRLLITILLIFTCAAASGQQLVDGVVREAESGETTAGVNVIVKAQGM